MITLLNGETWNKEEILKEMVNDEFYYGHLGQHALSSSSLKQLLTSPKAYKQSLRRTDTNSQALRDGQLVHLSVLEPHRLKDLTIVEGTKATKAYKEAVAELGGHLVYTKSEMDNAYWIADAVKSNADASYLLDDCNYEVPGVGMLYDLPFRAKADAMTKDGSTIIDLKTTSGGVKDFMWAANKYNYSLQASLYLQIFGASEFIFLVVDKSTLDIGIFECSENFLELGSIQIADAVAIYKDFFMADNSEELIANNVYRGIL